eukprot:GEMP01077604.1.p1 GENE.GEMP01077604.1~~GEMP01077604.1.p1  ORF type:complete len:220 (+),score=53.17 GEMP01077604.1:134-793(+)
MGNRETSVYLSKVAEQAERYDEMAEYMKKVAEAKEELNAEERNLFSVAYKNAVGSRRASWRIISDVEQKERTLGHKEFYMAAEDFRKRVEEELHQICNEVIALLNDCLIPMANNGESNVFYFKMKGDYFRYLAEFNADQASLRCVRSGHEHRAGGAPGHASHPLGPRTEFLRVLLRGDEECGGRVQNGANCVRRRHCRAGQRAGGIVQRLDSHYAAAAR